MLILTFCDTHHSGLSSDSAGQDIFFAGKPVPTVIQETCLPVGAGLPAKSRCIVYDIEQDLMFRIAIKIREQPWPVIKFITG